MRVIVGVAPALAFERPVEVLTAYTQAQADTALRRAHECLSAGAWVAGFLSYECGAVLAGLELERPPFEFPGTPAADPLLCLGVFEKPTEIRLPDDCAAGRLSPLLTTVDRNRYDVAVAAIGHEIFDGNVYQVNYTVPFALQVAGDPLAAYAFFARRSQAEYQAYVEYDGRAILSWSPELFLSFDGSAIGAKPMKGTAAPDRSIDLDNDKNRAELVMIADLLRNDLHRICDAVTVERLCEVTHFPTFATMTATIAGTVRAGTSLLDVIRATFPCGSVTGAPKRSAMSSIARHEALARGVYCGSIGFLSPQRHGWWNVAIRTAQVDLASGYGRYDAGGGIVADSTAGGEWAEVLVKSRFLRDRDNREFALLETFASGANDDAVAAHLTRIARSASAFGIDFDAAGLATAVRHSQTGSNDLIRVRVHLDGTFSVRGEALNAAPPAAVRVCVGTGRVWSRDPFLQHKTSWRPVHDAAAERAKTLGCFDALLQNERDELTEGARTNIFVESGGSLWTPPLAAGLLPGILRSSIVSEGRAHDRVLTLEDVRQADAVYVGNSARGLLRAVLVEEARS